MKNVLVFGASGFVGSNLIRSNSQAVNYIPVGRAVKEGWVTVDLADKDFTSNLPPNIDVVLYLAQSNEYRNFPDGSEDMLSINAAAILKLANWSIANGVKKIIYASTANVYKKQEACLSLDSETGIESFYGFSKLMGENILKQFSSLISVDILRFFSIYGPGQTGMLIPSMIEKVRKSELITLTNKEGLFLSPIYIDDVLNLIDALVRNQNSTNNTGCQVFNVSGDEVISLFDVVHVIGDVLNVKPCVETPIGQVPFLCNADKGGISEVIGGGYKTCSFFEGISRTVGSEA